MEEHNTIDDDMSNRECQRTTSQCEVELLKVEIVNFQELRM